MRNSNSIVLVNWCLGNLLKGYNFWNNFKSQLIKNQIFIVISGMIISAIAWGYIADTRGRKSILVWGLLADVVCVLSCAMSQSIIQLMIAKFIGGLV